MTQEEIDSASTASPNKTFSSSSLSKCRVLAWPLSLRSNSNNKLEVGIVVGWRTQHLPFPDTVVAAGILPASDDNEQEVKRIEKNMLQLKQSLCRCCTYNNNNTSQQDKFSCCHCAGCLTQKLLGSLQILAFYDNNNNDNHDSFLSSPTTTTNSRITKRHATTLPCIRQVKIGDCWIPWIDEWKDHDAERQILYFDDNDSTASYPNNEQINDTSIFNRDILTYMSNSHAVATAVATQAKYRETADPQWRKSARPMAQSLRASKTTSEDTWLQEVPGITRYSLFLQMVHRLYHGHDPMHLLSILFALLKRKKRDDKSCEHCRKRRIRFSRSDRIHQNVQYWNTVLRAILDVTVGIVLWWLAKNFLSGYSSILVDLLRDYVKLQSRIIRDGASWLERFPIGFKLNEPLTVSLGQEIRSIVAFHEIAVLKLLQLLDLAWMRQYCLVLCNITAITMGATGMMALLVDTLRLAHVHVWILSLCFKTVFRCELYLLSACWRVFRGKKLNVLRNRTDSMQYDSIQLLFGSILFAITLFLFTTFLAYHVFFAVCNLSVCFALDICCAFLLLIRKWPAGVLVTRFICHQWHAKGMYLVEEASPLVSVSATTLHPILHGASDSVFRGFMVPFFKAMNLFSFQLGTALLGRKTPHISLIL